MEPIQGTPATILTLLREGPRQAKDLAVELGIDTSAVRRHLEALRVEDLVETSDVIDGPGRPKKMYALTPAGRERFPRDYALLLDLVLAKVRDERGQGELESVMTLLAQDLAAKVQGRTIDERVASLLALYNQLGFDADLEREGKTLCLRQRNCIFLKTAQADPTLLCQCLDEGIMAAALPGARIELHASLAHGDSHCRHILHLDRRTNA